MDRQLIGYARIAAPDPWHRLITAIQEDQNNMGKNLHTPIHGPRGPARYPMAPHATPIGTQALEIIVSILEDPSPGLGEVQFRLRQCLATYPGFPERALLAHLVETSSRVNPRGGEGLP